LRFTFTLILIQFLIYKKIEINKYFLISNKHLAIMNKYSFSQRENITNIKYDSKLIELFTKALDEMGEEVGKLHINSHDQLGIQEAQMKLRDYFVQHMDTLNYCEDPDHKRNGKRNRKTLSKPDAFALMVGLVSNFNEHKCWEDLMNDFTNVSFETTIVNGKIKLQNATDLSGNEVAQHLNCSCVCGKHIKVVYHLKSTRTDKKLAVGCDCIGKVVIHNPDLAEELKKAKKMKDKLRGCEACHQYKIPSDSPLSHKVCKSCWFKHREELNRKCEVCGEHSIPKTSPAWKKKCLTCWKAGRVD